MWLLNTSTYELRHFDLYNNAPQYAILSHTWGEEEIDFQQMQQFQMSKNRDILLQSAGFQKVRGFCHMAKYRGFNYAWIDTCCIDKKSSAELDEAIRSMFKWYQQATVCFVFLADVPPGATRDQFRRSRWFKRGWTLQELIAPTRLIFFDNTWGIYGSLDENQVLHDVSTITRIDTTILRYEGKLRMGLSIRNIASKMSWASGRTTTRVEDEAYCLMGIFNVHMPIMYGEGRNAFYRLQKAILENSQDDSIFAWTARPTSFPVIRGLLAHSPSEFQKIGNVNAFLTAERSKAFKIDSGGLKFLVDIHQLRPERYSEVFEELELKCDVYNLPLRCYEDGTNLVPIGPAIVLLQGGKLGARILPHLLFELPDQKTTKLSLTRAIPVGSHRATAAITEAFDSLNGLANVFRITLDDYQELGATNPPKTR